MAAKKSKKRVVKSVSRPKPKKEDLVRIKVVGVGGGGGNAISRMKESDSIRRVEFIAINTDSQDLDKIVANKKIYIGKSLTKGLGTGMNPEIGRQAAEENRSEITEAIGDADLVFITAGFGGGTGTGAAPVVAEIARESGALTVAVVTKPFTFEGSHRMKIAQEGLGRLKDKVDTLVVVPNDRIFNLIDKQTSIIKAFKAIDDVLKNAVQTITELIVIPGMINVDFADIKAIMKDAGSAIIGVGLSAGAQRSLKAVDSAINSPLLDLSMEGAKGVLFCISGRDLKMVEVNEIARAIADTMDQGARVIFGAYQDFRLKAGQLKVTLIATGFNGLLTNQRHSLFASEQPLEKTVLKNQPKLNVEGKKKEEKQEKSSQQKKDSDFWDIPTFMRRKKQ